MAKLEFDPSSSLPDLKGKVAIVTGGNAGIGYETVKRLAMKGAKVYMGARNASRAAAAIAQLKAEGALGGAGGGQVEWLHLDLIVPSTTRDGAEDFLKRENRLDILVNNAGVLGFADDLNLVHARIAVSEIMSINHLGPFVLTTTLLPLLKKTAAEAGSDVRIITLSSSSHYESWVPLDWKSYDGWSLENKNFLNSYMAYRTTKGLNVLFAKELQRKLDEEHIPALSMAVDPGIVDTPTNRKVVASQRWFGWLLLPYINIRSMPVAKGAYTTLFAAASPVVKDRKKEFAGAYLKPLGVIATPKKETLDPVIARDLWETSERAVAAM
ncbi:hypothetical protein FRB93_000112 [Tulasnella sp. JGI-2019a]|nr:hypothetical protein FRB93_000112 [Tulasnella sp. JGI-2019a]